MRRAILAGGALVAAIGCGSKPAADSTPPSALAGRDPASLDRASAVVDSIVAAKMAEHRVAGAAVAIIENGTVLKLGSYGLANVETGEPVTDSTAFFVASVTKAITAAAVLRLVDSGLVRLDDSIGAIVPDLPASWRAVTVRHLLLNTSGLPDPATRPGESLPDWPTVIRALGGKPVAKPGSEYRYVETDYALLGLLLEAKGGEPYEDVIDRTVFEPLVLRTAVFGDWRAIRPGRAEWYSTLHPMKTKDETPRFDAERYVLRTDYPRYRRPGAGLFVSAVDLARFADALMAGRVLRPETAALMWEPATLADGKVTATSMGAWYVAEPEDAGWVATEGGARSVVFSARRRGLSIAVVTNTQGAMPVAWAAAMFDSYLTP